MRVLFQVSAHGDITVDVHSVTNNMDKARESLTVIAKTTQIEPLFAERYLSFKGTSLHIITSVVRFQYPRNKKDDKQNYFYRMFLDEY